MLPLIFIYHCVTCLVISMCRFLKVRFDKPFATLSRLSLYHILPWGNSILNLPVYLLDPCLRYKWLLLENYFFIMRIVCNFVNKKAFLSLRLDIYYIVIAWINGWNGLRWTQKLNSWTTVNGVLLSCGNIFSYAVHTLTLETH